MGRCPSHIGLPSARAIALTRRCRCNLVAQSTAVYREITTRPSEEYPHLSRAVADTRMPSGNAPSLMRFTDEWFVSRPGHSTRVIPRPCSIPPASARSSSSLRSAPRSALLIWATATVAFMASGFGLLGVRRLERQWQVLGLAGISSSLVLLVAYRPDTSALGIAVDVALRGVLGFGSIPRREWQHRISRRAGVG